MNPISKATASSPALATHVGTELASARPRTPLRRLLTLAQQVKDTVTIILLLSNGMLLFGILFGFGIPGLVLYVMRWKLVARASSLDWGIWVLSLLHELSWVVIFAADHPHTSDTGLEHYEGWYALGAAICALSLFERRHASTQAPASSDAS